LTLGDYEVQVRSIDASGDPGLWSAPVEFTVAIAPSNVNPTEDRLPDSTPTFSWSPVPGADTYSLEIVNDVTNIVVFTQSGFAETVLTVPDNNMIPLGRYRYTITAHNNPAGGGSVVSASTERLLTISTPPEVQLPFVAIYDTTPTITWDTPVGEVVTDVEVFNLATNSIEFTQADVTAGTYTVPNGSELMPGEYRVRARSYGDVGRTLDSDWSTDHVFQIGAAPVPLGPSEGLGAGAGTNSRTSSPRPTLTWNGSLDGESYKVWVSDLNTGRAIYIMDGLTSAGFMPPADLLVGNYRYWVQASTGTGERSDWSDSFDFTVVTPPSVDTFGPSILNRTPTITWNTQDRITSWQVWVNKVDEVPAVIQYVEGGLTSPEFTIPVDMVNGRYKVWVRGFTDDVVTEWSGAFEFSVGGRPVVTNPATTADSTPTLSWLPVEDAAGYEVYFSTENDISNPILRESGLSATSFTLTDDVVPGVYKFWVRAIASDGALTPWSLNSQATLTVLPIEVPVLNDVPDGSDTTPTITWSPAGGAVRYEIFISLKNTPTVAVIRHNNLIDVSFTPATPLAPGEYRVWVRSIGANSQLSAWSVPDGFTITAAESHNKTTQSVVQLVSLVAAESTWQSEDVTVSQIPARVISESGRVVDAARHQSAVAEQVRPLPQTITLKDAADQQSSDEVMAAWDDAIWNEESAASTPAPGHIESSSARSQAATTGWLAALAAFSPAMFRNRRKNRK
ncbi:MAG: hypothetical protein GY758_34375, partial [Fuerstiella sp.]|nr:hypothetical protein [Fuerstiella sp.]